MNGTDSASSLRAGKRTTSARLGGQGTNSGGRNRGGPAGAVSGATKSPRSPKKGLRSVAPEVHGGRSRSAKRRASRERSPVNRGGRHLSTRIEEMCAAGRAHSVGEILQRLGHSSFGASLAVSAVPEFIPIPIPGASEAVVIPSVFISAQMVQGKDQLHLPKWLRKKEISAKNMERMSRFLLPIVRRLEKVSRPRGNWVRTKAAQRLIGGMVIIQAALIALPIPGTNIPPAFAIFLLGMGLVERDHRLVIAGLVLGVLCALLIGGAAVALIIALANLI